MANNRAGGKRKLPGPQGGAADEANGIALGLQLGRAPQMYPYNSRIQRTVTFEPNVAEIPRTGTIGYGTIIQASFYEQWTSSNPQQTPNPGLLSNRSVAQFRWGEYGLQKLRWCIVIAVYSDSYIVLPIYTNEGHGLHRVPAIHQNNYLRMYDPRSWRATKPENPSDRDLHVALHGRDTLHPESHVRTSYPLSISLLFKPVKIVGYLTGPSAEKLRNFLDRRPWDRQVVAPAPAVGGAAAGAAAAVGVPTPARVRPAGHAVDRTSSSGSSDRQTRSMGPPDPIEVGPNKRARITPEVAGQPTLTYDPTQEFKPAAW